MRQIERIPMKKLIHKYFGDKAFIMMILGVAVPIVIQNGISNFVNLLDNIMVGRVGTEQMSGIAIVNQLVFSVPSFTAAGLIRACPRPSVSNFISALRLLQRELVSSC